jgi:2-succinyl-5-enolpyruvyl-6-hydroxy-3-cyclohexene-1-carboxylate synthase
VTCTSGTAAANLHPAVAEARESSTPLLVLTADRPPELRDVGAGQSIDQLNLFGTASKWFVEVGTHDPSRATAVHHRALACRAVDAATEGRPGPVHLNFPLRPPLAPEPEDLDPAVWVGRPDGRPWTEVHRPAATPVPEVAAGVAERLGAQAHGVIVCGEASHEYAGAAGALATELGWPLLADPPSGVRCGPHDRANVVAHYDLLLRVQDFVRAHEPGIVLRVGELPVSQSLRGWIAGAPQVVVDPCATWHDPARAAEVVLATDPAATLEALAGAPAVRDSVADPEWVASWRGADSLVPGVLAASGDGFEGAVAAALAPVLRDDALVWLSYSMPVRDVEAFFPAGERPVRFLSGRGANGIDGVVSSATGAVLATGRPGYVVIGDVALLHDAGGLLTARRAGVELTIVCLNNDGGAIFDFLPVAEHAENDAYERHIATSHGLDMSALAELGGLEHRVVKVGELDDALSAPGLIEVRTDRQKNVALHREAVTALAETLRSEAGAAPGA